MERESENAYAEAGLKRSFVIFANYPKGMEN